MMSLQRKTKSYMDSERQQTTLLKPSKISKIFISHMHGDHFFGLPTLLTDIGLSRIHKTAQAYSPIDIYGPPGLSDYLKTVFQISNAKSNYPCIVHELYSDPLDPRLDTILSSKKSIQYSDKRISVDPIFPSKDGFWELFSVGEKLNKYIHTIERLRKSSGRTYPSYNRMLWFRLFLSVWKY